MTRHTKKYGGDTVCKEDEVIGPDGVTCIKKAASTEDGKGGEEGKEGEEGEGKGGRRRHSRRHHHRRHHKTLRAVSKGTHVKAKTLRRLLKSKGLKVSGKKATLRARARKAHLIRGGGYGMGMASAPGSV
jgi:hypothetical protein